MQMKGNKIFLDTNILIYIVKDNTGKAETAISLLSDKTSICISVQVVNEFCNVASKKLELSKNDIIYEYSIKS